MEVLLLFYKIIAKFYDLLDIIYFRDYKRSPRKAVFDRISANDRILDLCTGTGTNILNMAKAKDNVHIVGVDLSDNMLKEAKKKAKKLQLDNVKFYKMDATKLQIKDTCIDKILISLVLHELEEELVSKLICETKRVLKSDGEIIITEWEISKSFSKKLLFFPIHILESKTYRTFIKMDLYSYFKKYGLYVQSITHCDYTKVIVLKKS